MVIAITLALAGITLAVATSGAEAGSLWRHAFHIPVVVAALRYGRGGVLAAVAAVLLYAPFVLPALEREGATRPVLEGLLTFVLLLGVGVLSAALAGGARRQRTRYEILATVQRALDGDTPLDLAVARLRACLQARLDANVGLAVHDGTRLAVAGAARVARGSAVAHVLVSGAPLFVSDGGRNGGALRRSAWPASTPGRSSPTPSRCSSAGGRRITSRSTAPTACSRSTPTPTRSTAW